MPPLDRALGILVASFLVSLFSIGGLKRLAVARGWVDLPGADSLKVHQGSIPWTGGLGILLGGVAGVLVSGGVEIASGAHLGVALVGALAMTLVGLGDDLAGLSPTTRFVLEAVVALAVAWVALNLGLFGTSSFLRDAPGSLLLVALAGLYLIGGVNAVNMQDGLDGLAGGLVLISCVGFIVVGWTHEHALAVQLALALAGGVAGFLLFNFPPASVFMGDHGSYLLGFTVAFIALLLSVASGSMAALAGGILLIGLPVLDAAAAIARRSAQGQSPFVGDRRHVYDVLLARGFRPRQVVFVTYIMQIGLAASGVWLLVL